MLHNQHKPVPFIAGWEDHLKNTKGIKMGIVYMKSMYGTACMEVKTGAIQQQT